MMKSFNEFVLQEVLGSPFKLTNRRLDSGMVIYKFTTSKRQDGVIRFSPDYDREGSWELVFKVSGSTSKTGRGEAYRIFATVIESVLDFNNTYHPNYVHFYASLVDESSKKLEHSRADLYISILNKLLKDKSDIEYKYREYGNYMYFEISRKPIFNITKA